MIKIHPRTSSFIGFISIQNLNTNFGPAPHYSASEIKIGMSNFLKEICIFFNISIIKHCGFLAAYSMIIGVSFPKGKAAGVLSSPPNPTRVGVMKTAAIPPFTHTYLHVVHGGYCTFKVSAVSAMSIRKLRTAFVAVLLTVCS